jgi:hypothetical protein
MISNRKAITRDGETCRERLVWFPSLNKSPVTGLPNLKAPLTCSASSPSGGTPPSGLAAPALKLSSQTCSGRSPHGPPPLAHSPHCLPLAVLGSPEHSAHSLPTPLAAPCASFRGAVHCLKTSGKVYRIQRNAAQRRQSSSDVHLVTAQQRAQKAELLPEVVSSTERVPLSDELVLEWRYDPEHLRVCSCPGGEPLDGRERGLPACRR